MKYHSTRAAAPEYSFCEVAWKGLAEDGGLFLPVNYPAFSLTEIEAMRDWSYQKLTACILGRFCEGEIPRADLEDIVKKSFAGFRDPKVAPLVKFENGLGLLELFHGPTFAFKDVALQVMGNLYAYLSARSGQCVNILGATSGDTGAAAIQAMRGKPNVRICILHPHGKVSPTQALQMVTVTDDNVLNIALEGNFDDCQAQVKRFFPVFRQRAGADLQAINSINIVRLIAQCVYYFYAYYQVSAPGAPVNFFVPTGNFGDIFAGYMAKRMGLPVGKLVIVCNENDMLARFIEKGVYQPQAYRPTHSPSMDIQVPSNFERYLYCMVGEDATRLAALMADFAANGVIRLDPTAAQTDFAAAGISNEQCLTTIRTFHDRYSYLLDPHSACAVAAYEQMQSDFAGQNNVAFATAHPAKFSDAIAQCGLSVALPAPLAALQGSPTRLDVLPNQDAAVDQRLFDFYSL